MSRDKMIKDDIYRYDTFADGQVLFGKKKDHLPAMGWNSWNAFGSGNTEALTKSMADQLVALGLDKLGYKYVVLDDGCYKPERVEGLLANEEVKFPSGFKSLADYIHSKGLLFGMYNDIGTNLCAGAAVGTCGHEAEDACSYIGWGVDFLKVDNCYYLWDNATFSDPENARYVFAPNIKIIRLNNAASGAQVQSELSGCGLDESIQMDVSMARITGSRASLQEDYVTYIGTYDGTGPDPTPVGPQSSELVFELTIPEDGEYDLYITYATGREEGVGSFLQLATEQDGQVIYVYDDFIKETQGKEDFIESAPVRMALKAGECTLRIMNHRRQENTLGSYGTLVSELMKQAPDNDIIFSICEWGKTSPQNWGYKVGDSWRILNDITFQVGADGDPGVGAWNSDYTTSIAAQYNKAVIMDEYAGLSRGWNDPDMLMIGMNGLTETMCRTHMAMWCMMNSPLMLGMDLRRVSIGDWMWNIISNKALIDLNQDALGIQAKRVDCIMSDGTHVENPDKEYVRDIERVDILCKPLADGSVAVSFINMSDKNGCESVSIDLKSALQMLGTQEVDGTVSLNNIHTQNLWDDSDDGSRFIQTTETGELIIVAGPIEPCDNVTLRVDIA